MNKSAAEEWLKKAWHDLTSAEILCRENHYTDSISVDLHYAIEKSLKSILAYRNNKIPKSHDLGMIYSLVIDSLVIAENEIDILEIASEYHIQEAYPGFSRSLPDRKEIKEVLTFAKILFEKVCNILKVDTNLIKK